MYNIILLVALRTFSSQGQTLKLFVDIKFGDIPDHYCSVRYCDVF